MEKFTEGFQVTSNFFVGWLVVYSQSYISFFLNKQTLLNELKYVLESKVESSNCKKNIKLR